jgi:xylulokinase
MEDQQPVSPLETLILVFDIGLTNCKALIFSPGGDMLAEMSAPYPTYHPAPDRAEQDPEEWWQAICSAMASLGQRHPDLVPRINAISITGHMHALICLGEGLKPLTRALILGDQRAAKQAEELANSIGLRNIYKITGARIDASMPAAKISWLKANAPQVFQATRLFLGCKDLIRHWMTGDRLTDPIDACATSLYDLVNRAWSPDLLDLIGIDIHCLPEIAPATNIAGGLRSEPAAQLGLKSGIPVVVGGGDDIEILGNGILHPGLSLEHLGTTGSFLTCLNEPVYDPEMALELYPHVDPEKWVLGGSITAAGLALSWAAEILGFDSVDQALSTLSETDWQSSPRRLVFLPHLHGERCPSWVPDARGAWIGLSSTHRAQALMVAAVEGVAFALKNILMRIENLAGQQEQIRVVRRERETLNWINLRSTIYEKPLGILQNNQPTGLGAMILAGVAIERYPDLESAQRAIVKVEKIIQPDLKKTPFYQRSYQTFERARASLEGLWREES